MTVRFTLRSVVLVVMLSPAAFAHDPISTGRTWSGQISRIFAARCLSCHRDGGGAPMALTSYGEVRPWAKAIKAQVLSRAMPPWGAIQGFGHLQDDASLPLQEISAIADWVEGGSPEGEAIGPLILPAKRAAAERRHPALSQQATAGEAIERPIRLLGLGVPLSSDGSTQIVAELPDGRSEPLLWIYRHRPADPRTYWLSRPVLLPRGSRVRIVPSKPFPITLYATKAPEPAR